jgi:hypothetical protein
LAAAAELLKENGTHALYLAAASITTSPQRASLLAAASITTGASKEPKKIEFYQTLQVPTEMKGRHQPVCRGVPERVE